MSGLIPTDRIFGLLEREFTSRDIEWAVAEELKPLPDADLSAHRILLDLAATPEGKVRLVTTNFDRLFEASNESLEVWQPPRLPDPMRPSEISGITHLHGRVTADYNGSEGEGFVLSSSEFGRAYLADGWATKFFREIIERFVVVFVGYAAEDPPVQYLLEALNKTEGRLHGVYAFQLGTPTEASARWHHKGIEAIAYSDHPALWDTLEAWGMRAKAPPDWYESIIELARAGPEHLEPHERGQVAHVVSTIEGARRFAEGDSPPPAEWLCVFDPYERYVTPRQIGRGSEAGPVVDPFNLYGLDSDATPSKFDIEDSYKKRDVPPTAWNAFVANRLDRQNPRDDGFVTLRGPWATSPQRLPSRLAQIGVWLRKVAYQPAAAWWAARQNGLHPEIQWQIRWELERSKHDVLPVVRKAWRYLFEAWDEKRDEFHREWFDLKAVIKGEGWDSAVVRRYAAIDRPYITAARNYGAPPKLEHKDEIHIGDLLRIDVAYPDAPVDLCIPDAWLVLALAELRKNLEYALHLETELGGFGLSFGPILRGETTDDDKHWRTHGLPGCVFRFSSLFERLTEVDVAAAYREFAAWPVSDDTIFGRLRIWAAGKASLIKPEAFGPIMSTVSDRAFWDSYHQRDLLLVLASRWKELPVDTRKEIELRLLKGPPRWEREQEPEFEERRAWMSLARIAWLADQGCEFNFNLAIEIEKLRSAAPDWRPEDAQRVAQSMGPHGGFVQTETEYSALLKEPLSSILSKALALSGRVPGDFLTERDPFAGLSANRPIRAFAALARAATQGDYPEWAWRTFLNAQSRKDDKPKFSALIAEHIFRYPDRAVADFIRPASDWLENVSKTLASAYPRTFDKVIAKLINVLSAQPPDSGSGIVRGSKEPDWTMEAINAPAGKIAQALFADPRTDGLKAGEGLPPEWLRFVNELLSLPGDPRKHALVIFSHNLRWFHGMDPNWTEAHLLCVLDGDDEDERNDVERISLGSWHP